jgi:uncharacterized repeat protein (TIGR01451 family)
MPNHKSFTRACAVLLGVSALAGSAAGQDRIVNTATLHYGSGGGERVVASNTVSLDVVRTKRPTRIEFRVQPPGYKLDGLECHTGSPLTSDGAPVSAEQLAAAPPMAALDTMQPVIIVVDDEAANRDPAVRETVIVHVDVNGKRQDLRLTETAPDSGDFAGGVPSIADTSYPSPCAFTLARNGSLSLHYDGTGDSLAADASILIDPYGIVFDSRTGKPIDGATITILDEQGNPAQVFNEDGVTPYPSTVTTGGTVTDAKGRPFVSLPGHYHFPLVKPGRYTYRITPPAGYSAPSTATPATLAAFTAPAGGAFIINDGSYGRAINTVTDTDLVSDIPLDPAQQANLLVTKTASVREASPGDFVQYRVQVLNRGSDPATGVSVTDTLPVGLRYRAGSARGAAEPVAASDGRTLSFALPTLAGGASMQVSYVVSIAPGAPLGDAVNRARATGPGVTSNEAAAAVRLQALLFTDAMTIIGRVTEGQCGDPPAHRKGLPGIRLLLEDGTFTISDKDGLYHFEGVRPGRHVVQIDTGSVPPTHKPVACDADTRQAGSAISRFVEGSGGLLKRVDFQLAPTGKALVAVNTLPIEVADDATAAGSRDWLAGQTPGIEWLFPDEHHNPRAPVLRVAIKHLPGQHVALTVNRKRTDPLQFDAIDEGAGVAVSRWSSLPLAPGDNILVARVLGPDGALVKELTRTVHVATAGMRADFVPEHSRLVADGLTRPLIAVRVTDGAGRPVTAGTLVPFKVDAPHQAAQEVELEQSRQLAGRERNAVTARVVGDDGLAFLALQPTTQAGAVHAVVALGEDKQVRTSEIRAWLAATAKDWVVVGFGAGTLGYNTLSRHAATLPAGEHGGVTTDGQLAVYAKGRIKGSWLLTMAYDSDRKYDPTRGLLGTIDPDRYYTVYGDGSAQAYDAPTAKKLYVRLERRQAYALFGDIETGLTDTQLTRYSRTLTGGKIAYEGRRVRATAIAAKTTQLYRRDEIQGNGLSGPYRLQGRDIVPNSDKITIETRNRYRSEEVLSSRQLTRHIDYDIDTTLATIRFREPILSRDGAQNPNFIVVDYEVEGGRDGQFVAAGRVAAKLAGGRAEIGVGAVHDETIGNATVIGIDAKARVGRSTEVRGELAGGGRGGLGAGRAFVAEVEHHGGGLDLLGYARQQDAGFGIGQQNVVEAGTRKVGIDGRYVLTSRLTLTGTAWFQENLDRAGTRIAGEAKLEYRRDHGTIFLGTQIADDTGTDGRDRHSRLLTLGGSQALFDGKLDLTGQTQFAPGGADSSVDFPVRHQILASWRVTPGIRLIGGYEIAHGEDYSANTARLGFDVAPWHGAKLMSTVNQQTIGENGGRTYAEYGLSQSLPLGKRWTVDATLDASSTLTGRIPTGAVINAFQPVATGGFEASGQGGQDNHDFIALTLGATYRADRWSWNGRIEHRIATDEDRWGLTSSVLRTLGEGRTLAASFKGYDVVDKAGKVASYATADVALAWRPLDSRWSFLERAELRHERADTGFDDSNVLGVPAGGNQDQVTTRAINNIALNYRTGPEGLAHGWEATLYYGAKYVQGRFADDVYDGFIDVTGFELRRDFGRRFDIGVQGSVQHAWTDGAVSFSGGPSAGVSPGRNLWISAGYNIAGYRDRDFEADRYTRAGPYVTMRFKFDQQTIGTAAQALLGRK